MVNVSTQDVILIKIVKMDLNAYKVGVLISVQEYHVSMVVLMESAKINPARKIRIVVNFNCVMWIDV